MKKILLLFLLIYLPTSIAFGKELESKNFDVEKIDVELVNCVTETTSWIKISDEIKRVRLLAYDPSDGNLNNEILEYTCSLLKSANKLEISYDPNVSSKDAYNRELVWLYVDGELLQDKLIKKGYGQVNYVNSEYLYLDDLCASQKEAIINHLGIWNYEIIEEKYCNSGIDLKNNTANLKKEIKEEKRFDQNLLYSLLFFNSGIVLLALILFLDKKVKNEKR